MNTRFVIPMLTIFTALGVVSAAQAAPSASATASALDRMHVHVATLRDAEQQAWIARGVSTGRLSLADAAALERDQASIVALQAALERHGHQSVDDALRVQHLQDLQDWAILGRRGVTGPHA
jgi:hypothetical protein